MARSKLNDERLFDQEQKDAFLNLTDQWRHYAGETPNYDRFRCKRAGEMYLGLAENPAIPYHLIEYFILLAELEAITWTE